MSMAITVSREGRRSYLMGDTYAVREQIRSAGGHWDADRKAWWVGSAETAEQLAAKVAAAPQAAPAYQPVAGEAMVAVAGNTYPARDALRALGGRWDGAAKVWLVPASQVDAAARAVASAPKSEPFRHTRCKQCGARPNARGWPRIYRSGICSDCYADGSDD